MTAWRLGHQHRSAFQTHGKAAVAAHPQAAHSLGSSGSSPRNDRGPLTWPELCCAKPTPAGNGLLRHRCSAHVSSTGMQCRQAIQGSPSSCLLARGVLLHLPCCHLLPLALLPPLHGHGAQGALLSPSQQPVEQTWSSRSPLRMQRS